MESGEVLSSILDVIIKGVPPAALFAGLWWLERGERIKLAEKLMKVLESQADTNVVWKKVFAKLEEEA